MKRYEDILKETNEINSRRNAKNTVFMDLFSIPKYLLQLFQALHPEMTDVTEKDIKPVTLNPVILNLAYNDLGILVKNKLMIFVEAQATWSINILVRILMYLASTYHDYITDNKLFIYGSSKLELPEPEFYVIYTGNKKFAKETISLKEDFWNNPNAKIDLTAKVIYSENKEDIIGQYIIFCHVLDEQIKIHGRNKTAVIETFRICQNENVLKEYLEGRKKEVMGIMFMLFDQEYNLNAYIREQVNEQVEEQVKEKFEEIEKQVRRKVEKQVRRKVEKQVKAEKIQSVIETCRDFGISIEEVINKIAEKFNLSKDMASSYVHKFWKEEN